MVAQSAELEAQRVQMLAAIERAEQLNRLENNRDFKKLILQNFMIDECAAYARQSVEANWPEDVRAASLGVAQAAGHLDQWFRAIRGMAAQMRSQLQEMDEAILEASQEGAK